MVVITAFYLNGLDNRQCQELLVIETIPNVGN